MSRYYIYYEISGVAQGSQISFFSKQFNPGTFTCVNFAYHNFGIDDMTNLKVVVGYGAIFNAADSNNKVLFEVSTKNDPKIAWTRAKLPIDEKLPFRVRLSITLGKCEDLTDISYV